MTATLARQMTTSISFEPPGPGAWMLDADHQSSPRGRLMQELFTPNFVAGSQECFGRYGMPLERLEGRHVNGWFYIHAVPAGVPDNGKPAPPATILRIVTRLLPELRRRRRIAADTIARHRWVEDAETWASERDGWLERCDTSLAADLSSIDATALAEHAEQALALAGDMLRRHFELLGVSVGVGRLLVAARTWKVDADRVLAVLAGSSPATVASRAPLARLAALTAGRRAPDTVAELRATSAEAAELVDLYMTRFGWRPWAADVEAGTLQEHPELLLELVRSQETAPAGTSASDPLDELRRLAPGAEHAALDELVDEARRCYAALDDNSGMVAVTIGALRRVVLEVARRAVAQRTVLSVADVFDLTPDELMALARTGTAPTQHEQERRRQWRQTVAQHPAPPVLGGPIVEPPAPSVFPRPIAELAAAVDAYLELKFTPRGDDTGDLSGGGSLAVDGTAVVRGLAVVAGTVSGRIVVSTDAADAIARIEPGDILVCPYTIAAHNAIFPMLGGVVTQFGGPLGHTAVLAREFGIPAVVATRSLPLHLDGAHGTLDAPT
jgi:pyruvate,water dikinase